MARNPAWIAVGRMYQEDGRWRLPIRLKAWHPSFLGVLWREYDVEPAWLKPIGILWLWLVILFDLADDGED